MTNKSGIHTNPAHKGELTRRAHEHGRTVQQEAEHELNSNSATTLEKHQAEFAINQKKWKHK